MNAFGTGAYLAEPEVARGVKREQLNIIKEKY